MNRDARPAGKILVVDDNVHGLTARKMILSEQGYDVETATSGEEGWEKFQLGLFDVVITDYRMGQMDGVELIRLIRQSDSPARTILLSGFVGCLGLTEESTGADEVICKSNKEVQELLRAAKKLIQRSHRRGVSSQREKVRTRSVGAV